MKDNYLYIEGSNCNQQDGVCTGTDDVLKKSNYLAEFATELDKSKARKNLGIADLYSLKWGNITGFLENLKDLQKVLDLLHDSNTIEYSNIDYDNIKSVKDALEQLLYISPRITYDITPLEIQDGIVTKVKLSWNYNKKGIVSQRLDGELLDLDIREIILEGPFDKDTHLLLMYDGLNVYLKNLTFRLLYYGTDLSNLSTTEDNSIDITASEGEYIYILSPNKLDFYVGGICGGFEEIDPEFLLYKFQGLSLNYILYRSDNSGLGNTKIDIVWPLN